MIRTLFEWELLSTRSLYFIYSGLGDLQVKTVYAFNAKADVHIKVYECRGD